MDLSGLQAYLNDLIIAGGLRAEDILVVGCSTSEVSGQRIGTAGSLEIADNILNVLLETVQKHDVLLAVQCCEHLNRALVIERNLLKNRNLTEVCVIPQAHAGGSLATVAWQRFDDPIVVEYIRAEAGVDIGDTEIAMHVKHVQVPYRHPYKFLGEARVTGLTSRAKLIGGERAVYHT